MMKKFIYPVFLDLENKKCVVVGGGKVAERKCISLIKSGARITVISPDITKRLLNYKENGRIRHVNRHYRSRDLQKAFLVIAATDSAEKNREIADDVSGTETLLNVVDSPSLCNFIVPAVVRRGLLTIAVSTSGASPAMSRAIRKDLERIYGPEYSGYLNKIRNERSKAMKNIKDKRKREKFLKKLAEEVTKTSKSK